MDQLIQAVVLGLVQGLTEFLPVSSSGHLIIVPELLGWHDPFIESLAFSVMLHIGTLGALLLYFRDDWLRLIPAGLATIRDRTGVPVARQLRRAVDEYLDQHEIPAALRAPGRRRRDR